MWAERFDRDMTDIFEVQDELTRNIVEALKVHLTPDDNDRLAHKTAIDLDAYTLFLRARERAEHAVGADPEDTYARFALAVACIWGRDLDRALAEAEICLSLMPNSPEGCLALAHAQIFDGNAETAIDTLDAYMKLDPHYPDQTLQFVAEAYISVGRFEDAASALTQRLKRDPQSVIGHALLASTLGNLGRIDDAREMLDRLFRLDPDFSIERRRKILPFRNLADFERRHDGFKAAGLYDRYS